MDDNKKLNILNGEFTVKLGSTFTSNSKNLFHTLKYDFKPASVDVNKDASIQIGSNNQVTVTVPNLDTSGVPNTIFKGNQRGYSKKECVLIIDHDTNEIVLEKLHNNIQVKKTRTDSTNKPISNIIQNKVENQTARQSSKTRVSTGVRKNVVSFVPKNSPNMQGSPNNRSPQSATLWNANNSQQTLPSIPIIGLDDGFATQPPTMYNKTNNNISGPSKSNIMQQSQQLPQLPIQQQQQQQQQPRSSVMQNLQQPPQQQQQQRESMSLDDNQVGVLSTSDSSSSDNDSDDSDDSDSDSDDSQEDNHVANNNNNIAVSNNMSHNVKKHLGNVNHDGNSIETLRNDLDLSSSGSDSD